MLGVVIGVLGFLGILMIIAVVLFKKKRKNDQKLSEIELEKQKISNDDNDFGEDKSRVTIIKYEALTMKEILGEGSFGVVQR